MEGTGVAGIQHYIFFVVPVVVRVVDINIVHSSILLYDGDEEDW